MVVFVKGHPAIWWHLLRDVLHTVAFVKGRPAIRLHLLRDILLYSTTKGVLAGRWVTRRHLLLYDVTAQGQLGGIYCNMT